MYPYGAGAGYLLPLRVYGLGSHCCRSNRFQCGGRRADSYELTQLGTVILSAGTYRLDNQPECLLEEIAMLVVPHEMDFARDVSNRLVFMN